ERHRGSRSTDGGHRHRRARRDRAGGGAEPVGERDLLPDGVNMGRFIGLDIGARHVRAALLATRFRRVVIERLEEAAVEEGPDAIKSAITTAASHLVPHIEGLATAIDGELAFVHRLLLPPTAMKQLAEVLPFELEAQVPVDLDELTYDYRALRRERSDAPVAVIAAAARIEHVRARIDLVRAALGREPDRI